MPPVVDVPGVGPRKLSWIPQRQQFATDRVFLAEPSARVALPPSVDLRPQCPEVYDQGRIGSCVDNAVAGLVHFDELAQNEASPFVPSRLQLYYDVRAVEGTIDRDAGGIIRDCIRNVATLGVAPESLWPYDDTPADPLTGLFPPGARATQKPPASVYAAALAHKALEPQIVPVTLDALQTCLASGRPLVIGSPVFPSMMTPEVAASGQIPMPGRFEQPIGGHAYMIVGYDVSIGKFLMRNSWSTRWALFGYAWLPFDYLLQLGSDGWMIPKILVPPPVPTPAPPTPTPAPLTNQLTITGRLGHIVWGANFWGYLTK